MRVLVEQTRACAVLWLHRLGRLAGLAEFDENDRVVRYEPAWGEPGKVAVAALMGGETNDRWREHPESELLLVGTQDMLMSRALNRGYAAWPQDWPVEFGLLNIDSLWVMDEVQLMGPARTTSVQLQVFAEEHFARRQEEQLPPRRTLWMSATMGTHEGSLDPPQWMRTPERGTDALRAPVAGAREDGPMDENDLMHDFGKRWRAQKQLELHVAALETGASPGQRRPARRLKIKDEPSTAWTIDSDVLVERIVQEATSGPHRTVLVFVNRVDRARALFDRLSAVCTNDERLLLLHARFRPRDRRATEWRLNETAPPDSRIVVSTQVLEAGVDLDAHALFTEVCPWPSLVQRLGRLNRRGELPLAPAVVFDVQLPPRRDGESDADYRDRARRESSLPYEANELDITRTRLDSVSKQGGSVSPEALSKLGASIELAGPIL
jgi:CRISPR-associated endonuclease/helicase Cas3